MASLPSQSSISASLERIRRGALPGLQRRAPATASCCSPATSVCRLILRHRVEHRRGNRHFRHSLDRALQAARESPRAPAPGTGTGSGTGTGAVSITTTGGAGNGDRRRPKPPAAAKPKEPELLIRRAGAAAIGAPPATAAMPVILSAAPDSAQTVKTQAWPQRGLLRSILPQLPAAEPRTLRGLIAGVAAFGAPTQRAQHLFHRQQPPQVHQLQQPKLKVEPLLLPITQLIEGPQQHLQKPRQLFLAEQRRRSAPRASVLQAKSATARYPAASPCSGVMPGDLRNHAAAQVAHRLPGQLRGASCRRPADRSQSSSRRPTGSHLPPASRARTLHSAPTPSARESAPHPAAPYRSLTGARRNCLVHNAQRIAHRPIAGLRQQVQCAFIGVDPLMLGNPAQLAQNVGKLYRMEAEVLAPATAPSAGCPQAGSWPS